MFMENTVFRFGQVDYDLFYAKKDGINVLIDPFITGKTDEELSELAYNLYDMMNEIRSYDNWISLFRMS